MATKFIRSLTTRTHVGEKLGLVGWAGGGVWCVISRAFAREDLNENNNRGELNGTKKRKITCGITLPEKNGAHPTGRWGVREGVVIR